MGPFDLAKSMDIEFGGEEHERTIASVLEAARGQGKKAAIFCESTRPSSRVWSSSLAHTSGIDCLFFLTRRLGGTSETTTRSGFRYGLHLYGYGVFSERDGEAGGCDVGEVRERRGRKSWNDVRQKTMCV